MLTLASTVLMVTITFRAADEGEDYLLWAIFAALIISGAITALHAGRVWRLGAGHVLMTGAGPYFIAVSVLALTEGGWSMLASLIVISSLFQFALAAWLPAAAADHHAGRLRNGAHADSSHGHVHRSRQAEGRRPRARRWPAGPSVAAATLVTATALAMRASGVWRLWALLIGIASGCAVAAFFGLYDVQRVVEAPWFNMPDIAAWPGLDLAPDAGFWALLPAFVIVALVVAIKTSSEGVVIQQVSRRSPRATDFRLVQGAINTNGLGTLLSGIAGTPPTVVYLPSTVSLINLTGVAARSIGYVIGVFLLALAFLPKVTAILLTFPSPVMGGYLLMIMGLLFVEGMRTVVQDGLDHRKALVIGVALSIGVGLENQNILADLLGRTWGASLGNGMTVGVLAAILMTSFIELTSPRRRRLEVELAASAMPRIDAFLSELASRIGWNDASTGRLRAAGEETLSSLLQSGGGDGADCVPRLIIVARPDAGTVELEFLAVFDEENLEDRLAYLSDQAEAPEEHEISFRLLRHYASTVRHKKYHGIDIVAVQVEGSR